MELHVLLGLLGSIWISYNFIAYILQVCIIEVNVSDKISLQKFWIEPTFFQTTETKGTVLITNADELINFSKSEEESMEKIVKPLAESGVTCVVSGGKIGELALHMLDKYQVIYQTILISRGVFSTPFDWFPGCLPVPSNQIDQIRTVGSESNTLTSVSIRVQWYLSQVSVRRGGI